MLVEQGQPPCGRLFFVLSGGLHVFVQGNAVGSIDRDMAAGEFPVLHPGLNHGVTLRAKASTVVAEVDESVLVETAETCPSLWKNMARVLALRLDGRASNYPSVNRTPRVFVGSSTEGLSIAREIQLGLDHDSISTIVWSDGVFTASRVAIESLMDEVWKCDFGVFVVSPDDLIQSRQQAAMGPRDNVVFEIGLFMGRIGRERTLLVVPRRAKLKIPSDLLGFVTIDYEASGDSGTLSSRIAPVNTRIRKHIAALGPLAGIRGRR